ncbi:MAG TPA: TetR/AcrR family transcriptional regulator [Alphaproteobacteria bacterium]|nr:TetR/AcrR family transcriptional regulator [Alphaproteobacteria bacterium]
MATRRRRKEARPGELVAAALTCFAERGFAATRLDDIAAKAGVSKGTVYLYFPSKEELFKAVVRESLLPNIARAETMLDDPSSPAAEQLRRLLEFMTGRLASSPVGIIPKLVVTEAGNFPDIARFYLDQVVHRGFALVGRLLTRGIERGEFRNIDVRHTTFCVIAPILLTALWRHSLGRYEPEALDPDALWRTHIELLLRGLRADGAR